MPAGFPVADRLLQLELRIGGIYDATGIAFFLAHTFCLHCFTFFMHSAVSGFNPPLPLPGREKKLYKDCFEAEVEAPGLVDQGSYADVVHSGAGIINNVVEVDTAAGLCFDRAIDEAHGLPDLIG